ncbi:MAG: DUF1553 domain-containing protein [Saprospiraceae bacterium]|nr:DUF1553 domain-containing protein [Saprospiraceae bacterium]
MSFQLLGVRSMFVSLRSSAWEFMAILFIFLACTSPEQHVQVPEHVDFNFHVRPILSNQCFLCHGPDSSSREAGLRLDIASSAMEDRDGRKAIVPGDPSASELIRRIFSDDPKVQMPPPHTNKVLSAQEKAILRKWINEGAEWKPYWAFIPPVASTLPDETDQHPIDHYIQERHRQQGLQMAPRAEKESLIRRLAYLLTGLPPSEKEMADFIANEKDDSFSDLVDYYLASPHYGERWARHWMDLARYAEGKGHEFDYPVIGAWRYRDYLIRAFNQDVSYDLFIKEQLAGDILSDPRIDPTTGFEQSHLGTTFLMLAEGKHSPVDIKEEEKIMIDNMIDVTSKTFQALTVACARCHDHKFDDIPTTDYYSLYGIFESSRHCVRGTSILPGRDLAADSINQLRQVIREMAASQISDESSIPKPLPAARYDAQRGSSNRQEAVCIGDFRKGDLDGWYDDGYAFGGANQLGQPRFINGTTVSFYTEGVVSSRHYGKGIPGALRSPTFIVDKRYLKVRAAGNHSMIRVISDNFQLIQNPIYGSIAKQVSSTAPIDYVLDLKMIKDHKAYVELLVGEYHAIKGKNHYYHLPLEAWLEVSFAYLVDSVAGAEVHPVDYDVTNINQEEALKSWVKGTAKPEEIKAITPYLRSISNLEIGSIFAQAKVHVDRLRDTSFIAALTEGDPVLSSVFVRGDHNILSDEKVPHRFFTALDTAQAPFTKTSSGRLELAESIATKENPLTARVMVNRVWHQLFGRGIVTTVDNFGLQGTIPSHPALLDYLAIKFMDDGWSIKRLIKFIVTSETFQQSTSGDSISAEGDPTNIYLSHFPIRRLEAEAIRDGMLAVSGKLDTKMYGPSIPIFLTPFLNGRGKPPASGPIDGYGRRSVYQAIWRNFLPPMMLTFDMPIPFSTFGKRSVTNVPAQSLTLLNDDFVIEQAAVWAKKISDEEKDIERRITNIYRAAFSRAPTNDEVESCRQFLIDQGRKYELEAEEALHSLRLWTELCHSIFNMKEFIYLL